MDRTMARSSLKSFHLGNKTRPNVLNWIIYKDLIINFLDRISSIKLSGLVLFPKWKVFKLDLDIVPSIYRVALE